YFFFSSRRRHTRLQGDWSSDVCSSDLGGRVQVGGLGGHHRVGGAFLVRGVLRRALGGVGPLLGRLQLGLGVGQGRVLGRTLLQRSEERRVGKECRCRCVRYHATIAIRV